jgi:hypothetical protein
MANSSRNPVVGWLTAVAAALSIAVSIGFSLVLQGFQGLFKQLGGDLPLDTQLFLLSCPWLWLGAVLSILIWLLYRRKVIPCSWALTLLSIVIICTIAVIPLGLFAMYQPMFKIFELVR